MILLTPMSSFLLGGGKLFFQAAVLHVHHIDVVGLLFRFGEFFFGQRIVAEEGALTDIIQITRMNEGFFRERGLFLNALFAGRAGQATVLSGRFEKSGCPEAPAPAGL